MKKQKLTRVVITLAEDTKQLRASLFAAKAAKLLQLFCPGTETSFFSDRPKMLAVARIRTQHGLYLTHAVCAALAEGMELNLASVDFDINLQS